MPWNNNAKSKVKARAKIALGREGHTSPQVLHLTVGKIATDDVGDSMPREVVHEASPMLQHKFLELLIDQYTSK